MGALYSAERFSDAAIAWAYSQAGQLVWTLIHDREFTDATRLRVFRNDFDEATAQAALAAQRDDLAAGVFVCSSSPDLTFPRAVQLSLQGEMARAEGLRVLTVK